MAHGSGRRDLLAGLRGATAAAQSVGQQRIGAKRAKSQEEQRGIENVRAELAQTFRESRAKSEDEFRQSAQNLQEQKRADSIKQAALNAASNSLATIPKAKAGGIEHKQLANLYSNALGGGDVFKITSNGKKVEVDPTLKKQFGKSIKDFGAEFGAKAGEAFLKGPLGVQDFGIQAVAKAALPLFENVRDPVDIGAVEDRVSLFEDVLERERTRISPITEGQAAVIEGAEINLAQERETLARLSAVTEQNLVDLPPGSAFKQAEAPKPPPGVFLRPGSGSIKEIALRAIVQSVVDNVSSANINEAEKKILALPTGEGIGDLLPEEQAAAMQTLAEVRLFKLSVLGQGPE